VDAVARWRVSVLRLAAEWLADPAHWRGSDGILTRMAEHLALSGTGLALAALLALPAAVWLGHTGRGGLAMISLANIGRALPSLAILAVALPVAFRLGLGLGFWPTVFMLVPLGVPLILINGFVAIQSVDRDLVDVARGMGMRGWEILREVELPLASPIILAGVRNAAVTIVATATLGALVASGGLGRYIVDGLARQETGRLVAGAILVALLSIATEASFGALERIATPAGVSAERLAAIGTFPEATASG
jgi:osmoprotectant transport system permease protein